MVQCGIIILGNYGVGKSFLANILLGKEYFESECRATKVTQTTDYKNFKYDGNEYAVFNVPGLIEDDQEAIDRNKQEIYLAFDMRPNSVIIFVFNGGAGGRIRNEDVIAFNAINKSYKFKSESLLLVINDLPVRRPQNYDDKLSLRLREVLDLDFSSILCLNRIDSNSFQEKEDLRLRLASAIQTLTFATYRKVEEIRLQTDEIKKLKEQLDRQEKEYNKKIQELEGKAALLQNELEKERKKFEDLEKRVKDIEKQLRKKMRPCKVQ